MLRHGMALVAAALVLGFGLSAAASRLLEGLLFGVDPADPPTLVAVAVFLTLAALGASLLPARRAMRVDPLEALRSEQLRQCTRRPERASSALVQARSRSVRSLFSIGSPAIVMIAIWLSFFPRSMPTWSMASLPISCALERVHLCWGNGATI